MEPNKRKMQHKNTVPVIELLSKLLEAVSALGLDEEKKSDDSSDDTSLEGTTEDETDSKL